MFLAAVERRRAKDDLATIGVVTSVFIHLAGALSHLLYPLVDQHSARFPILDQFLMEIYVYLCEIPRFLQ